VSNVATRKRGLPPRVRMRHESHFVEELAARNEPTVGRFVALTDIEVDPRQPRSVMGDLEELAASIRDKGILEPLLVRPRPEDGTIGGPSYRIIAGERRFRAAQLAGVFEVPVIEMDVTEDEALEIALVENLQRKDLTPFEEAEGYRALAEIHGYTQEEVAQAVGKSRTVVTEGLALLQIPPRVRDAVQALGVTSKSVLLEVLKAGSEDEMIQLLEEVSRLGLNRDDLRRRLRRPDSSAAGKRRPYVFKFRSPDKTFQLSLAFRQSTVDQVDLIRALEQILGELRRTSTTQPQPA
jgi:ParB family transcriptional regulator, chromosome partitioning protein